MSCHGLDGSAMVGPSWLGHFGSERALEDRNSVVAGEDYLAKSIREPDAAVVKGYPKVMPAAYSFFSIEDVEASIGHIKILVVADPSPGPGLGPTAQLDQRVVPAHEPTSRLTDAQLGAESSSRNCAVCHGENGEGGAIGPSLTSVEMQAQEDDNVRQVVNDGIEGTAMPAWAGRLLITQDIEDVITFLRSVQ